MCIYALFDRRFKITGLGKTPEDRYFAVAHAYLLIQARVAGPLDAAAHEGSLSLRHPTNCEAVGGDETVRTNEAVRNDVDWMEEQEPFSSSSSDESVFEYSE